MSDVTTRGFDPIGLEVAEHRFAAIAEEMGEALVRSAISPNIKERRDLSCGVFDGGGRLVAHAAHIPVHLGAMPASVAAALRDCPPGRGDVVIANDPYRGGTHLPDITVLAPVYLRDDAERPAFHVASRAHHADVGGMVAGSMPRSTEIYQEGVVIPPVRIVRGGRIDDDLLALILANVRNPRERDWDLRAQLAVLGLGATRLGVLAGEIGAGALRRDATELLAYAETRMRATLSALPDGEAVAEEVLEPIGGETPCIRVRLTVRGDQARLDFAGSSPAVAGPVNAVRAVTESAVCYVFRCLLAEPVPANAGILAPLAIDTPPGSIVDARSPSAVAAGNVETSQRIVDVVLRALAELVPDRIPAASAGTMLNVAIGGTDAAGRPFTYYETIAGGAGGGPGGPGASGLQTHMTNTRNTPVEAIAHELPLRIVRYRLRAGSGGAGAAPGGDGIERVFELRRPATVSILAERLASRPYGLAGGAPGAAARIEIERDDGTREVLEARTSVRLEPGDRLHVLTPGGGGYGQPPAARAAGEGAGVRHTGRENR
ncbi:MAG: hydantoinase B/oxoprolinase family protein [Candidatus Eiseniibacteriota bacterium]|jgi:N-methylhydantoinase B